MKAKITGKNKVKLLGKSIVYQGRVYTNPEHNPKLGGEVLFNMGYREYKEEPFPDVDGETMSVQSEIVEEGNKIIRRYKITEPAGL